jgi:hypothetical protein
MGVGEDRLFTTDLPVHMTIDGWSHTAFAPMYDGGWATTDASGNVTFGSGGHDEYIHCTGPTDFLEIKVVPMDPDTNMDSYAYQPYESRLEGDYRFFEGTLTIEVKDVCGNPVQAKVSLRGGPVYGADALDRFTDPGGRADFVYKDPSGGATVPIKILPNINLNIGGTQMIDDPAGIVASKPLYVNGTVELLSGAYSFKPSDRFDLTIKLFRNDNEVGSDKSFTVKPVWTDEDRRKGLERYRFSVQPQPQPTIYRVEACLDDTDGKETTVGSVYRDLSATVKPIGDRTLDFQYVPVNAGSSGSTAAMEECADRFLPVKVNYRTAPPLTPSLWPWEGDRWRLSGWFRELENFRISQSPAPDLVVGLVPPGSLSTYTTGNAAGLAMDSYRHVVLLDPSRTRTHHLIHEFMHTLGLPDNYGGTLPPASAPGYTEQGHRIWNTPNTSALYCAIMYDFAPVAWPTSAEYDTLINRLTEPISQTMIRPAASSEMLNTTTPPKVMLISGVIEDSFYGSVITRRSPVFIDEGTLHAPQEVAPGAFQASGVRALDNGQEIVKAYLSNNMNINGSVEFGSIIGTMNFALPWQEGIDTLEFCTFGSGGAVIDTMYDSAVTFSANAPTVQWVSAPAAQSTLSDEVSLTFQATDADPDASLWAWIKISTDGGQTWRSAGNYFAIESSPTTITLDCSLWPNSSDCRIKLLVTDDGNTTALQAGPYQLEGYNPNPSIVCDTTPIQTTFTVDQPVIIPLAISNAGGAALEVHLQSGSLPDWIRPETVSELRLAADSRKTLFLIAEPNLPQTYTAQIDLQTNDPAAATVSIPVQLHYQAQTPAPTVCWAGTLSGDIDGSDIVPGPSVTILARDQYGRNELDAYVTILKVSNGLDFIADKVPMEPAGLDGMYAFTAALDENLAGEKIAFEFDMVDPATGLADNDGLYGGAYDFTFNFIRPNNPPVFTALDPQLDEYEYISTGFGQSLDLSFTLDEFDGDPVSYMVHSYSSLPFELDAEAGTLHCLIPLPDDPYNSKFINQTVELVAVDRFGAQANASWQLNISPYNRINNRAYPYYSSTVLSDDIMQLQAFSFSALEGQYCRIEYRPQGTSDWTLIGQSPYDIEHPGIYYAGRMARIPWDTTGLTDGGAYEVRFVDYWPGGTPDTNPPVVLFRKAHTAGQVTQIIVPSPVAAGQPFDFSVEVENQSAHTWTLSDGYEVVAPSGADPLTGLDRISPAAEFAQVWPEMKVIYAARTVAADQSGVYTMTWQARGPDGPLGVPISVQVEVTASVDPAMPGDMNNDKRVDFRDLADLSLTWYLDSQHSDWNPACDLNPDLQINLLDLATLADHWLEQF